MKSVQIRNFFWSVSSSIRTEYEVNLRIQAKYGKIRTRKHSIFGHFSHSEHFWQIYLFGQTKIQNFVPFGYSVSTLWALRHSGTQGTQDTRMLEALCHSRYSRNSDTKDTRELKAPGQLGTQAIEAFYLADSRIENCHNANKWFTMPLLLGSQLQYSFH